MADLRVVDTSTISYFLKEPPDTRAALYEPHVLGYDLIVASQTVAELYRWTISAGWGPRRVRVVQAWLARVAIYAPDDAVCWHWARLMAAHGTMGVADAWVAATALELGAPLITHNRRHFAAVAGLTVISEAPSKR